MQSLTIIGRRWFSRPNGNTYHTAQIIVDGETVAKTPMQYGYGNQYVWTAGQWLEDNGYMPERKHHDNGSGESLFTYFRDDRGVAYEDITIDVDRKRDL